MHDCTAWWSPALRTTQIRFDKETTVYIIGHQHSQRDIFWKVFVSANSARPIWFTPFLKMKCSALYWQGVADGKNVPFAKLFQAAGSPDSGTLQFVAFGETSALTGTDARLPPEDRHAQVLNCFPATSEYVPRLQLDNWKFGVFAELLRWYNKTNRASLI